MTIIKPCCCVLCGDRQGQGATAELFPYKDYQECNWWWWCYSQWDKIATSVSQKKILNPVLDPVLKKLKFNIALIPLPTHTELRKQMGMCATELSMRIFIDKFIIINDKAAIG